MAKSPPFNDVGESCPSREILICENKIVANLFEYTVDNNARSFAAWLCSQFYDVTQRLFFQDASNFFTKNKSVKSMLFGNNPVQKYCVIDIDHTNKSLSSPRNKSLQTLFSQRVEENVKPHSHCADVATVHPDSGQPVYCDAPGHIS